VCVAGTRWVRQEILKKTASPDLVVYAIWFKMMPGDDRDARPDSFIDDPRVVEMWDEQRLLGRWLASQPQFKDKGLVDAGVMWDTFLLFGRESRWEDVPTHLVSSGYTIVRERKRLEADLPSALAPVGQSGQSGGGKTDR
jgi:hypothetical protein